MLKYIIIDVDGTLTDGGIYYDGTGNELKKFCVKDGTGISLMKNAGIVPIILTGRECIATTRRMTDLGITEVYQNIKNKAEWISAWMNERGILKDEVGYIGDDVNDLTSMKLCGFVACPLDAVEEVKEMADYVASVDGGNGVLSDVIRHILKIDGMWDYVLNKVYGYSGDFI